MKTLDAIFWNDTRWATAIVKHQIFWNKYRIDVLTPSDSYSPEKYFEEYEDAVQWCKDNVPYTRIEEKRHKWATQLKVLRRRKR